MDMIPATFSSVLSKAMPLSTSTELEKNAKTVRSVLLCLALRLALFIFCSCTFEKKKKKLWPLSASLSVSSCARERSGFGETSCESEVISTLPPQTFIDLFPNGHCPLLQRMTLMSIHQAVVLIVRNTTSWKRQRQQQ